MSSFVLALCHEGAERALKTDALPQGLRSAFQGKGLVTFKHDLALPESFRVASPLARFSALSLGKVKRSDAVARAKSERAVLQELALNDSVTDLRAGPLRTRPGQRVLTLLRATPGDDAEGWLTVHIHDGERSGFAGERPPLVLPPEAPSRAWLKLEEAIARFSLPLGSGARVLEIGSAPGGASWAALARGASVVGVDPNEMAPAVLSHPRFQHVRAPSTALEPTAIAGPFDWLLLDVNVPPGTALRGALPFIEAHAATLQGLSLTLKLGRWELIAELPGWLERIRRRLPDMRVIPYSGYEHAQEIGVVAFR